MTDTEARNNRLLRGAGDSQDILSIVQENQLLEQALDRLENRVTALETLRGNSAPLNQKENSEHGNTHRHT